MNISLPNLNLADVTRSIAVMPDLVRETVFFAKWNYSQLTSVLARRGEADEHDHDHAEFGEPMPPWVAGRIGMEITMLIRSHREFPKGHREAMDMAVEDIATPQHAMDVIMALASMFNHVVSDEQIDMFSQSMVEAEARES